MKNKQIHFGYEYLKFFLVDILKWKVNMQEYDTEHIWHELINMLDILN